MDLNFVAAGTGSVITINRVTPGEAFAVEVTNSHLVPGKTKVTVPFTGHDAAIDRVVIHGGATADVFNVTTQAGSVLITEVGGPNFTLTNSYRDVTNTTPATSANGDPVFNFDNLTILGRNGDDQMSAAQVGENLIALSFQGEGGNDLLVGSKFSDVIDGGLNDDTLSGLFGVDLFYDAGGNGHAERELRYRHVAVR